MIKAKAIYSELTMARPSAAIPRDLAETQRQAKELENSIVEKREGLRYAPIGS